MSQHIDLTRSRRADEFWLALTGAAGEIDRPSYRRIPVPHAPRAAKEVVELQVRIGDDWGAVTGWEIYDAPSGGRRAGAMMLKPPYAQPGDTMVLSIEMRPNGRAEPAIARLAAYAWEAMTLLAMFLWIAITSYAWITSILALHLNPFATFALLGFGLYGAMIGINAYLRWSA